MEKEILHEKFMTRCISLAKSGLGNVAPNPLVGCIIVYNNQIIGEGYHVRYGNAHAEVNAVNSVKDKSLLHKSTLYVNLEPCVHFGKTPPCCDLIINKKIPEVVIGCIDSFSEVSGKGTEKLKNSGCKVIVGIKESECRDLNSRFFTFHEKKRPYIILKWAQTSDGYIDIKRNENNAVLPIWITNDTCKMLVHKWRTEEDAFMAGTNTVIIDNPQLTARDWYGRNPKRIIIDRTLRIPKNAAIYNKSAQTIIFTGKETKSEKYIEFVKINFSSDVLHSIIKNLHSRNIQSLVVEGGAKLLQSFINSNLWDEARIFYGNGFFNDGIAAPQIHGTIVNETIIDNSRLVVLKK